MPDAVFSTLSHGSTSLTNTFPIIKQAALHKAGAVIRRAAFCQDLLQITSSSTELAVCCDVALASSAYLEYGEKVGRTMLVQGVPMRQHARLGR